MNYKEKTNFFQEEEIYEILDNCIYSYYGRSMNRDTKAFTNMLEMKCGLLTSEWVYGIFRIPQETRYLQLVY